MRSDRFHLLLQASISQNLRRRKWGLTLGVRLSSHLSPHSVLHGNRWQLYASVGDRRLILVFFRLDYDRLAVIAGVSMVVGYVAVKSMTRGIEILYISINNALGDET